MVLGGILVYGDDDDVEFEECDFDRIFVVRREVKV